MPKLKATWDTPIDLTPKGHAAALFIIAREKTLDVFCDPATRDNEDLCRAAAAEERSLRGLMQWQGVHPLDCTTITEEAA